MAEVLVPPHIGGGRIVLYRNGDFTAYCGNYDHGCKCKKTRTSHAGARPEHGRPLGFLMAWLFTSDTYNDQHDHVHFFRLPKLRMRRAGRESLRDLLGGPALIQFEAGGNVDGEEPRRCP